MLLPAHATVMEPDPERDAQEVNGRRAEAQLAETDVATSEDAAPCDDAPAGAFTDVRAGSTHASNIDCIAAYRITLGVGGGRYDPSGYVPRGQMASFLVRFVEITLDEPQPRPRSASAFRDIAGTAHADNIRIAEHLGITIGQTADRFRPGRDVTRAQMATFVSRALEAVGADLDKSPPVAFTDHGDSVHRVNIDRLASAGIVRGHGSFFDPDGPVTRAQMATFLANTINYLHEEGRWTTPLPIDETDTSDPSDDDGSGEDEEEDEKRGGAEAGDPTIESAQTDPVNNLILVTFDQPVTCPTSTNAVQAWDFENESASATTPASPSGSPISIQQHHAPSVSCSLMYEDVSNADFGTLSYTQPSDEADQVTGSSGPLKSASGTTVVDGEAPQLTGVAATAADDQVEMIFDKPVLCESVTPANVVVERADDSRIAIGSVECDGASSMPRLHVAGGALVPTTVVSVRLVGKVYSESGWHTVPLVTRSSFVL